MLSWYYNLLNEVMYFNSKILWYGTFLPLILKSWKSDLQSPQCPFMDHSLVMVKGLA